MSGLLQEFAVASDDDDLLKIALQLPWKWHKHGATHYRVSPQQDGSEKLCLMWAHDQEPHVQALPFPLKTPEALFRFARDWLAAGAVYPTEQPDTDGSVSRGWKVGVHHFYSFVEVKAEYIVYGK